MSDSERPAGYFSTFSILDPNGSTFEGLAKTQRRNRRVFVCIPCHRRKLKCDKRSPCSRCVQTGAADECVYQPLPSESKKTPPTETSEEASSLSGSDAMPCRRATTKSFYRPSDRRTRGYGATHWASIASEFEEATAFVFGTDPQWEPRYRQVKGLKYLFDPTSGAVGPNFPFSGICPFSKTKEQVLDSLPPRRLVEMLAECYFRSFEVTHRLLHAPQFWEELHLFWESPETVSESWLAQLCMMLALGCQSVQEPVLRGSGRSSQEWIDVLLDGAQFCFALSPYFLAPDLIIVRTMCMFVLAKMTESVKGSDSNQLVYLMGMLTRLAMTMQLHRTTTLFPEMPLWEAEIRRRIWVTIQLLDVDSAMRTGTSFLCRDQDADAPLNLNDTSIHRRAHGDWVVDTLWETPSEYTDSTFQVRVAEALPLLIDIVSTVNSPTRSTIDYDKVTRWDAHLHHHLKIAEHSLTAQNILCSNKASNANLQLQFFTVLVHRALLAVHHLYARAMPSSAAIVKSSLALLKIQQVWCTSRPGYAQAAPPIVSAHGDVHRPQHWLVDLCHDDFGSAMLYIILALRRQELDEAAGGSEQHMPSREVAYAILHTGLGLLRERACRSVAQFKQYIGMSILVRCLQCLRLGEPLLPALLSVANQVEQTILTGKQNMIWAGQDILMQSGISADAMLVLDSDVLGSFA